MDFGNQEARVKRAVKILFGFPWQAVSNSGGLHLLPPLLEKRNVRLSAVFSPPVLAATFMLSAVSTGTTRAHCLVIAERRAPYPARRE